MRLKRWLLCVVLLTPAAPVSSAVAEDTAPRLDSAAVRSGFQLYREQTWGMVRSRVSNPTDQAHQPLVSTRLEPRENVEFSRRLWLPPRSRREAFTPVFPFEIPPGSNSIEAPTRLIDDSGRRTRATPWYPALLPVRNERLTTVHLGDWDDRDDRRIMVRALRAERNLDEGVLLASGADVPTQPVAWAAVDAIVLSSQRPELNALQREALRRWLVRGGRLWIMLDRVDSTWLADVLGDSWDISVSDRVGLHEFTIPDAHGRVRQRVESDYGVEMVRAFATDKMEVVHRVNGYPASMRRDVGQGKMLVTTLGPEAWIQPEEEKALPALADLNAFFEVPEITPRRRHEIVTAAFEPFVRDQIGYEILGRGWVATMLGGFVVVLLGSGLMLAWRGRLEMIGVTGAIVSVAAAGSLIGLGMTHHGSQPLTVATGQLIHTHPEQPYIHTIAATGIYVPTAHGDDRITITGQHGVSWPADVGVMGSRTWLEWFDHDQWRFPGRAMPPGVVHRFAGEGTQPVDEPLHAVLRFTEDGISGEFISNPFPLLEDAVIATRWGHLPATLEHGSDRFRAGSELLGRRQFVPGATVTDRQNQRQRVYRALAEGGLFPRQPALMGWIRNGPVTTMGLNAGEKREVHSLIVAPLRIERPAAGESITIPSVLMDKRPPGDQIEQEYRPGGLYDVDRREWISPIARNTTALMQFTPPKGLGRLDVQNATLRFHLRAPGWRYEVLVWRDGGVESVAEGSNPLGEVELPLTGEQAPQMTEDGAMLAGLRIERADGAGAGAWSLGRLDLSVTAVADAPRDQHQQAGEAPQEGEGRP